MHPARTTALPALQAGLAGRPAQRRSLRWWLARAALWPLDATYWQVRYRLTCRAFRRRGATAPRLLAAGSPTMPYRLAHQTSQKLLASLESLPSLRTQVES